MRVDIIEGATLPDYELPDHTNTRRKLSLLQGNDPMILMLGRGFYCPKDRQQLHELVRFSKQCAVGFTRLVTITTDTFVQLNDLRLGVGADWPFLLSCRNEMIGEGAMTNGEVSNLTIENNEAAQRWEARVGQHLAVAEYRRRNGTVFFTHTKVPPELKGQGVASWIVRTALDDARTQHLAVVPFCPFVASYIRRHPDYKTLVHPDHRDLLEREPGRGQNG